MDKTGIIWTEKTWNPVSGCQKVSQGCKFCYAETIAKKFGNKAFPNGFGLTLRPHKLREPYGWSQSTLCFVNSMSDLFWDQIPDEYRKRIIDVIADTPQHEYQVLTKRPEAMLEWAQKYGLPANFWAGVTVENRKALSRIDLLKQVPAQIRFISFEPLIEDLGQEYDLKGVHWAITGGESGAHMWKLENQKSRGLVYYSQKEKRFLPHPVRMDWVRSIREKCRESDTHFFHKQWGGHYPEAAGRLLDGETYNDIPRLPGGKQEIDNEYLRILESKK